MLSLLRRGRIVALAVAIVAVAPTPALASRGNSGGSSAVAAQKKLLRWALGSNANSLRDPAQCGQKVGGEFLLSLAFAPGTKVNCVIPRGVPLLASPGGSFATAPFDAPTPAGLDAQLDVCPCVSDPKAVLDGKSRASDIRFSRTGVYTIAVAENAVIRDFYPDLAATTKKVTVASLGWTIRIAPLAKGHHTLVLADKIGGDPFDITFDIKVR